MTQRALRGRWLDRHELGARDALLDGEQGDGATRLAPAVGGAAGVDQQQVASLSDVGTVRVANYHNPCRGKLAAGAAGVGWSLVEDMHHSHSYAADQQLALDGQRVDHLLPLDVALHGVYRRVCRELVKHGQPREVAG